MHITNAKIGGGEDSHSFASESWLSALLFVLICDGLLGHITRSLAQFFYVLMWGKGFLMWGKGQRRTDIQLLTSLIIFTTST